MAGGIEIAESHLENMLKEDYDPEKFDTTMKQLFSESGYFREEEKNIDELKCYIKKAKGEK